MNILKYFGFKRQCMECGNDALPGHDCKGESRVLSRRSFFFLAAAAPIVIAQTSNHFNIFGPPLPFIFGPVPLNFYDLKMPEAVNLLYPMIHPIRVGSFEYTDRPCAHWKSTSHIISGATG